MRRTSACLGLLFVMLGWCLDEPLQQRVSYDKPGQTLKSLLRDLSAQTNLNLYAAPPLDAEIVLVAVKEMPLQTLMEHIAYVVDGEWIAESERQHRLARTLKVIAKRKQEDREQALADLRKMLASEEFRRYTEPLTREEVIERMERIRKQLRELEVEEQDENQLYERIYDLGMKEWLPLNPERRLLCRILQQMDMDALADTPPDERRVFSTLSGRYLLPLRVNLAPLLQQWLKEREIFRAVITDPRYQFPRDESGGWRYTWWMHELFELQETQDASTTRLPAKVFLQVRRYEWRKDFSFSLYLVDEQNREIATGYYYSNEGWETEEERIARLSKQDNALVQPVEWRKETQQWLDAWRTALSKGAVKPFPEFLDPSKHEPLQFVATDVLRSYARHKNLPLVALLNDEMVWWIHYALRNKQRVADFLTSDDVWEISATENVLRIRALSSSLRWRERESREAVSRCIRQVVARGYLGLSDALEALHQPNLADPYIYHLGTGAFLYLDEPCRSLLPLLKNFWKQMETLSEGKVELPLHRLSPKQIQELEHAVYSSGYISLLPSDGEQEFTDSNKPSPVGLPHAYFPNGLPRDAVLVCEIKAEDGVLSQRSGVGVWGRFYDVADLQRFFHDKHSDYLHIRHQREFIQNSLLVPAQRQDLTLSLRVAPYRIEIISTYDVYGYRPTQGLKPMRWEQLPPEWLKPPNPQEASEDP
jgi:hypothetical protein